MKNLAIFIGLIFSIFPCIMQGMNQLLPKQDITHMSRHQEELVLLATRDNDNVASIIDNNRKVGESEFKSPESIKKVALIDKNRSLILFNKDKIICHSAPNIQQILLEKNDLDSMAYDGGDLVVVNSCVYEMKSGISKFKLISENSTYKLVEDKSFNLNNSENIFFKHVTIDPITKDIIATGVDQPGCPGKIFLRICKPTGKYRGGCNITVPKALKMSAEDFIESSGSGIKIGDPASVGEPKVSEHGKLIGFRSYDCDNGTRINIYDANYMKFIKKIEPAETDGRFGYSFDWIGDSVIMVPVLTNAGNKLSFFDARTGKVIKTLSNNNGLINFVAYIKTTNDIALSLSKESWPKYLKLPWQLDFQKNNFCAALLGAMQNNKFSEQMVEFKQ